MITLGSGATSSMVGSSTSMVGLRMSVVGSSAAGLNVAGSSAAGLNVVGLGALGLSMPASSTSSALSSSMARLSGMGSSGNPIIIDDDEDNDGKVDGEGMKSLGFINLTM